MVKDSNGVEDGNIEELESAPEGTSPEEKGSGAASAGDGKNVTPETQEKSGYVPKARFDEVYQKAKRAEELEEALAEHQDKFVRDPITGKLKFRVEEKREISQDDDDELNDEDRLAFDETQMRVVNKLLNRQQKQIFQTYQNTQRHNADVAENWGKAQKKFSATPFGNVADPNSEIAKEAEKILREEYAQPVKNAKGQIVSIYVPPKAHFEASEKAFWRLKERAEESDKAKKESDKMKKQNGFINRSSKVVPEKGKASDDDFENMTPDEQSAFLEKEHKEQMESQENKE